MILVTGATGTVGSAVCTELDGDATPVRAAVRSPDHFDGPAEEVVEFDFTDPTTYRETFDGVDSLFLVRPPQLSRIRRDIVPALAAAVGAGVEHVVFLSVIGADRNQIVPHAHIESWLDGAGVETTYLRASFFMQNLTTVHREEVRDGELFVPAGDGATSFVDARDVAAVGARALTEGLTGAYDLTGPEALDYHAVAAILSATLDHDVRYANPSLVRFLWRRYRIDRNLSKTAVMAGIYTTARLGLAGRVTDDLETLLGRAPTDFETFTREHRESWQ
ncbi:NmrA family NAD(P)-binding protein [Natronomonas gomsonensis]|uniref:NmrA family NAD(P)-binding protein n=1 Tax=Natronomonas gomsonensis TaxID=1046043 RepID=UPI0015C01BF3|nr:NmrA family NAD(P)-binding protein [Natronomonas gomsonensis]